MADETQNSQADGADQNDGNGVPKVDAAVAEAEKWKNDFLYLRAEFENYKRNAIKERSDLAKYGAERLVRDLLAVIDNFDRALKTPITPQTIPDFVKGVEMTAQEFKAVLQKNGVQEIPSEGQPFNPQFQEAVTSEETDAMPEGYVSKVFQKAYKMHDKVIRPGQVAVSKKVSTN